MTIQNLYSILRGYLWGSDLSAVSVVFRILLSFLAGGIIGYERSTKRHSAGLRTFILVTLAGCIAAMMDLFFLQETGGTLPILSAAVIIGAATICGYSVLYSSKNQIKGLTTSAGLWASGIIGLAIGAGFHAAAILSTIAMICGLAVFPALEKYLKDRSNHFEVHLELTNAGDLHTFTETIRRLGMRIDDIELNPAYLNSGVSAYTVLFTINSGELKKYKKHEEIIEALRSLPYVSFIEEM